MLYFIFALLLFAIFGNVLIFAIKATWGIAKIVFTVLLLPLFLIGLVIKGLMALAMPVLVILGIVFLLRLRENR